MLIPLANTCLCTKHEDYHLLVKVEKSDKVCSAIMDRLTTRDTFLPHVNVLIDYRDRDNLLYKGQRYKSQSVLYSERFNYTQRP